MSEMSTLLRRSGLGLALVMILAALSWGLAGQLTGISASWELRSERTRMAHAVESRLRAARAEEAPADLVLTTSENLNDRINSLFSASGQLVQADLVPAGGRDRLYRFVWQGTETDWRPLLENLARQLPATRLTGFELITTRTGELRLNGELALTVEQEE